MPHDTIDLGPQLPDQTVITRVVFERLRFGSRTMLGADMCRRLSLKAWEEHFTDAFETLMLQLETEVLAWPRGWKTFSDTARIEVPASAWDNVKIEWFPTFARWARRPGRMKYSTARLLVDVDFYDSFPYSDVAYPDQLGRPVEMLIGHRRPVEIT